VSCKTLLSWSTGKDSAWSLHVLRQQPDVEVGGTGDDHQRRLRPPSPCTACAARWPRPRRRPPACRCTYCRSPIPAPTRSTSASWASSWPGRRRRASRPWPSAICFLEDIRRYRESKLAGTGITPLFPLWGIETDVLARTMIDGGLEAYVTCVDPSKLPERFCRRRFDAALLAELPGGVDPCAENGEFHTFACAGPMFRSPIAVEVGETVTRDGFVFCDLLSK